MVSNVTSVVMVANKTTTNATGLPIHPLGVNKTTTTVTTAVTTKTATTATATATTSSSFTSALAHTASSMFSLSSIGSLGAGIAIGLLFGLIITLIVLTRFTIRQGDLTRLKPGTYAVMVTPENRVSIVRLTNMIGPNTYLLFNQGYQYVFQVDPRHRLTTTDGRVHLFFVTATRLALSQNYQLGVGVSVDPLLALDVENANKILMRSGYGTINNPSLLQQVVRIASMGDRTHNVDVTEPVYGMVYSFSLNTRDYVTTVIREISQWQLSIVNALSQVLDIHSATSRILERLFRMRLGTFQGWSNLLLTVGIVIMVLMLMMGILPSLMHTVFLIAPIIKSLLII